MQFKNRIRLPFKLTRPQYPKDKTIYRYADGNIKVLNVEIRKTYEGETDWISELWHERLVIALEHDDVFIEGDSYLGNIVTDGDYEIAWEKFLGYPKAKSAFTVQVTPFNNSNNNCKTCEEVTQIDLVDDQFPNPLEEGQTYGLDVYQNDSICCYPAVFSILTFDTTYIESASISQEGVITVTMKATYFSATNKKLLTYKVTCPNQSFDTADVYGDVEGETPTCEEPTNLSLISVSSSDAMISFTPPAILPDHYFFRLYKVNGDNTSTLIQENAVSGSPISLTGLEGATEYKFFLRSQCDDTNNDDPASIFVQLNFTTNPATDQCGQYILLYPYVFGPSTISFTYLDCNGDTKTIIVRKNQSVNVCAMQTSPGVPTSITHSSGGGTIAHGNDSECNGSTGPGSRAITVGSSISPFFPSTACSSSNTYYIDNGYLDITTGVSVYTDVDLTILATSLRYITDTGGTMYNISGGTVGSLTGSSC